MAKSGGRDVSPSGKGWKVTQPRAKEPISHHRTQANAEAAAKADLGKKGGGEVRIHTPKGVIRDSDTVSPGNDPRSSRDTKH